MLRHEWKVGDKLKANHDVFDEHTDVRTGDIDEIESISSDHHGGLQLNLKKNGRGWSDYHWDKVK